MARPVGDDRGVSPVIGVALLIAITVVLAAVIGFVVFDAGTGPVDNPSSRLDFSYNGGADVTVSHEGGDTINASNVEVVVNEGGTNTRTDLTTGTSQTTIETGDTFTLGEGTFTDDSTWNSGDTVKLVWSAPDADSRSQLASFTIP